jgi:dihydrofolate reductase
VISLVVATSENGVIGSNNQLPWRLPNDLQRFKALTMGKPIIMGRKTYESIGKPLPGRQNIVITRKQMDIAGCTVVDSIEAALRCTQGDDEAMIIGGAEIYRQALPQAQRIYLTQVHTTIAGDAVFPPLQLDEWRETLREKHAADDRHAYDYSFLVLERVAI